MPKTFHGKISASTRLSVDLSGRFNKFKESFGGERSLSQLQVDSIELMLEIFSDKDLLEKVSADSEILTTLKALQRKRKKDKKEIIQISLTREQQELFELFKKVSWKMED